MSGKRIGKLFLLLAFALTLLCGCTRTQELSLRKEGIALLAAGDYQGAAGRFTEALKLYDGRKPGRTETDLLRYLAEAQFRSEDYDAAESSYESLIAADGGKAEYLDMQAVCLVRKNALADAQKVYAQADAAGTKSAAHDSALLVLGEALTGSGGDGPKTAEALYQKAADGGRESTGLYCGMGNACMAQKKYTDAAGWYDKGLALADAAGSETGRTMLFNKACCLEYTGEYQKALDCFGEYEKQYGQDEQTKHETAFLKSRLQ